MANNGEHITVSDALEKQLGLKLEEVPVPAKALVVDSVVRKATDNPPGVKEVLPEIAAPTEFEVADVKLADPNAGTRHAADFRISACSPGGGSSLKVCRCASCWTVRSTYQERIRSRECRVGRIPSGSRLLRRWRGIIPAASPDGMDPEFIAPLIRSLLAERFGLVWHTEQRLGTAYSLVAAKAKMKKADPQSRIYCRTSFPDEPGGAGAELPERQHGAIRGAAAEYSGD